MTPSPTMAVASKAREMKARGERVIDLSVGEPDYDTPERIVQAAEQSLENKETKYTDASGTPALKKAVCSYTKKNNGLDATPENVVVSCGAKQALYNVFQVLLDEGDEALVPIPAWPTFGEQMKLCEAKPVEIPTLHEENFQLDVEELEKRVTEKTRLLLINSPSNPTGAVYSEKNLKQISDFALAHKLWVVADEVYNRIYYEGEVAPSIVQAGGAELQEKLVVVNAVSKTFAMTGWRIGWLVAPKEIAKAAGALQGNVTSNPTTFAQSAAAYALENVKQETIDMVAEYKKRRDFVLARLEEMQIPCAKPDGAFYVFPKTKQLYKKNIHNSVSFCEYLLEKARVAVVPGAGFSADEHVRISYASSMKNLEAAMEKLGKAVTDLE